MKATVNMSADEAGKEAEVGGNADIPFFTLVICYTIMSLIIIGYALLEGNAH